MTVISVGPLHTMAAVLKRQPQIAAKASFVGMHGSLRRGGTEYNVIANIPAAQQVLSAPWRHITITPVDTCGQVNLSGQRFQTLKGSHDPSTQALLDTYRVWAGKKSLDELQASSTLFDTVAVYLANPGDKPLIGFEKLPITVTKNGFTRIDPKGKMMLVATTWKDLDGFRDLLVKTLLAP
jgi:inosine-uridine nucleoside N-ribohydrolase